MKNATKTFEKMHIEKVWFLVEVVLKANLIVIRGIVFSLKLFFVNLAFGKIQGTFLEI